MDQKLNYVITIFFIIMMFCVMVTQAVVELRKGESIQFFDVFEDTFVTPVRNAREADEAFDKLESTLMQVGSKLEAAEKEQVESGSWDTYEVEMVAEEAMFNATDIRRTLLSVNRHITADSTHKRITRIDSLHKKLKILYESIQDGGDIGALKDELETVTAAVKETRDTYNTVTVLSYPVVVIKHFFAYTVFSSRYLRSYENELEETSVFANSLRPPMQFMRYSLLGDLGEKAIQGKKAWLFYKPGFQYLVRPYILDKRSRIVDPEDTPILENAIDTIVAFQQECAKHGAELLVVIVPGKASVYPDLISDRVEPQQACKTGHSLRVINELREKGIPVVDLFSPFGEARMEDAEYGDSLYLARDTHWRTRGARVAARSVAERIREYTWFEGLDGNSVEFTIDSVEVERIGDVGTMTALPEFSIRDLHLRFPPELVTCHQVYQVRRDEEGEVVSKRLFHDDYRRSKILVLGDSFSRIYQSDEPRSAGWISHLAYELSQPLASIVSDGGASTLVRETLARKVGVLKGKKLVVWEFVERDLRYGAEGWKDIEL
jgi:hypothetical protein